MNSKNQATEKGDLYVFSNRVNNSAVSDISNTYAFTLGGLWYIIDTSCGKRRLKELRAFTAEHPCATVLCTHYHNDHIANNGRVGDRKTPVIYHFMARGKIRYLRTNSTGQILMMYRDLDREGFLRSLGFFRKGFIHAVQKNRFLAEIIMPPLLFTVAWLLSRKTIGRIHTGRKRVVFLEPENMKDHNLGGLTYSSWEIAPGLYAIETPGHTDCHVSYYVQENRTLYCGDALNFLNPNDIQFGSIKDVMKTQKLLLELAKKLRIERLCMGHYEPLTGNASIIEYINDIIKRHEHIYKLIFEYLKKNGEGKTFNELYDAVKGMDDEVIRKLARITFPRSTLVFLDVYLLKIIKESGLNCGRTSHPGS